MGKIKFNLIIPKPARPKRNKSNSGIIRKVDGIVIEENDSSTGVVYKVKTADGVIFPIHPDSYNTKGWRKIYAKAHNGWFCWDRVILEDRIKAPAPYLPFKPGFAVKGAIVEGFTYKITKCYNPNDERQCIEASLDD